MANTTQKEAITSTRIILYAQGISVIASIAGFIGLIIAYRSLTKNDSSTPARVPTIT